MDPKKQHEEVKSNRIIGITNILYKKSTEDFTNIYALNFFLASFLHKKFKFFNENLDEESEYLDEELTKKQEEVLDIVDKNLTVYGDWIIIGDD